MRVILDIDEKYAGVISITAIKSAQLGYNKMETNMTVVAHDLSRGRHISINADGKGFQEQETEV